MALRRQDSILRANKVRFTKMKKGLGMIKKFSILLKKIAILVKEGETKANTFLIKTRI